MRGLAACLVGLVGLGALATMAACSDSTDSGSAGGGAGGSPAAAGSNSGGKANSAGSTSTAGTGGGGVECGFATEECNGCLTDKCETQTNACAEEDGCLSDLLALPNCVCDPANDAATCIGDFVQTNGDTAQKLAECYTVNCEDLCQ